MHGDDGHKFNMKGYGVPVRIVGLVDDFEDKAQPASKKTVLQAIKDFLSPHTLTPEQKLAEIEKIDPNDTMALYGEYVVEYAGRVPCRPALFVGLDLEYKQTGGVGRYAQDILHYARGRIEKMSPEEKDAMIKKHTVTRETLLRDERDRIMWDNLVNKYGIKPPAPGSKLEF